MTRRLGLLMADERPSAYQDEVARGERFEFGQNWRRFLAVLDEERVNEAEANLRDSQSATRPRAARAQLDHGQ